MYRRFVVLVTNRTSFVQSHREHRLLPSYGMGIVGRSRNCRRNVKDVWYKWPATKNITPMAKWWCVTSVIHRPHVLGWTLPKNVKPERSFQFRLRGEQNRKHNGTKAAHNMCNSLFGWLSWYLKGKEKCPCQSDLLKAIARGLATGPMDVASKTPKPIIESIGSIMIIGNRESQPALIRALARKTVSHPQM